MQPNYPMPAPPIVRPVAVKRPWYSGTTLIVAALVVLPPISLALMWWGKRFPVAVRVVLTVFLGLLTLAAALVPEGHGAAIAPPLAEAASAPKAEATKRLSALLRYAPNRLYTTKANMAGWPAARTRDKLDKAIKILNQGDNDAFEEMLRTDPWVVRLRGGLHVFLTGYSTWSGVVRVRLEGSTTELWTVTEALDDLGLSGDTTF
jgi:hypothetical protein